MRDAGDRNLRILLARAPQGVPVPEDFNSDVTPMPTPGPGQFLARTVYLALDPHQRAALGQGAARAGRLRAGEVMLGESAAQVMESRHPDYRPGEYVWLRSGWQQFTLSSGQEVRKIDPAVAPISTALGVLGLPGLTGYAGLLYLGQPKPGETVVVSAATGAVGCTVGQVARLISARPIGIAGSAEKCDYAVRELGFAACLNHRQADFAAQLSRACPDGIHVYFDNAGGAVLEAALARLATHARVVLCGMAAGYNLDAPVGGASLAAIIAARATLMGILAEDYLPYLPEQVRVVGGWIRSGQFRYREDLVEGLNAAPAAFCRLLRGENFGKALVRVGPEHL
jgi:NADPH-dependent curcumin reductase CurA